MAAAISSTLKPSTLVTWSSAGRPVAREPGSALSRTQDSTTEPLVISPSVTSSLSTAMMSRAKLWSVSRPAP